MKTLLSFLILPFSFTLLLIIIGCTLRWYGKLRYGTITAVTGFALLLWFASYPGSWLCLAPLERMYPPLNDPEPTEAAHIVVLGGGYNTDVELPPTARLNKSATRRLTEGLRIQRQMPHATLILSGGGRTETTSAQMMQSVLHAIGDTTSKVELETSPRNTEQEAQAIRERLGEGTSVIVVTSARHMPRAIFLFQTYGLQPIAAPTDHELQRNQPLRLDHFVWKPGYLNRSHYAFHEYFGILWAWLRQ